MASAAKVPTNETIETYNSAGGATYTSANTWESLRDVDLPAISTSYGLEVTGVGPHADNIFMSGETSNSSYFRRVFATSSLRHGGIPGAGVVFRLNGPTRVLQANGAYGQFQFLEAIQLKTGDDNVKLQGDHSAAVACISSGETTGGVGFVVQPSSGTSFAINCLAFNCVGDGFRGLSAAVSSCVAYNCLATNCGDDGFDDLTGKNCISENAPLDYENCTTTTCIDEDGSGDITATLDYVDASNLDFHLAATDTEAIGQGTNLSSDGTYAFDDDITGTTRSSWDIGPFAYVAAGAIEDGFSDTVEASDALAVIRQMSETIANAVDAGESWAMSLVAQSGLFDEADTSDLVAAILRAVSSQSDVGVSSDVLSAILEAHAALSEASLSTGVFIGDVIKDLERSISDTAMTTESYAAILVAAGVIASGGTASDALSMALRAATAVSDSADASGTVSAVLAAMNSVSDSVDASNEIFAALSILASVIHDVDISDSFDAFLSAVCDLAVGGTVADAFGSTMRMLAILSESVDASDSFVGDIVGALTGEISGDSQALDAFSSLLEMVSTRADSVDVSDVMSSLARLISLFSDSATVSDEFSSSVLSDLARSILSGSYAADEFVSLVESLSELSEDTFVTDGFSSSGSFLSLFDDIALLSEGFVPAVHVGLPVSDEALGSDAFLTGARWRPSVFDQAVAADLWASQMLANVLWAEGAIASSVFSVPAPFNVGLVSASIRVSSAIAAIMGTYLSVASNNEVLASVFGTINAKPSIEESSSLKRSIDANVDINQHYNE